ncbi:MAG: hypothetical protein E6R13_06985 [Spirochaetes bacterium]|nr:MAG: hypothetical protein E6R13_06985 [Spirochaetota bacterium]
MATFELKGIVTTTLSEPLWMCLFNQFLATDTFEQEDSLFPEKEDLIKLSEEEEELNDFFAELDYKQTINDRI